MPCKTETAREERQKKMKPMLDISLYQVPSDINYDLMAANVSGVITTAIIAGIFCSLLTK